MAIFGTYIAFYTPAIDGGIPIVSDDLNQTIGSIAFGAGAFILYLLAGYAFYEAVIWYKTES